MTCFHQLNHYRVKGKASTKSRVPLPSTPPRTLTGPRDADNGMWVVTSEAHTHGTLKHACDRLWWNPSLLSYGCNPLQFLPFLSYLNSFKIFLMLILSFGLVKMSFSTYITLSKVHKHLVTLPIPTTVCCV